VGTPSAARALQRCKIRIGGKRGGDRGKLRLERRAPVHRRLQRRDRNGACRRLAGADAADLGFDRREPVLQGGDFRRYPVKPLVDAGRKCRLSAGQLGKGLRLRGALALQRGNALLSSRKPFIADAGQAGQRLVERGDGLLKRGDAGIERALTASPVCDPSPSCALERGQRLALGLDGLLEGGLPLLQAGKAGRLARPAGGDEPAQLGEPAFQLRSAALTPPPADRPRIAGRFPERPRAPTRRVRTSSSAADAEDRRILRVGQPGNALLEPGDAALRGGQRRLHLGGRRT
jgi:hypothetical protein